MSAPRHFLVKDLLGSLGGRRPGKIESHAIILHTWPKDPVNL